MNDHREQNKAITDILTDSKKIRKFPEKEKTNPMTDIEIEFKEWRKQTIKELDKFIIIPFQSEFFICLDNLFELAFAKGRYQGAKELIDKFEEFKKE